MNNGFKLVIKHVRSNPKVFSQFHEQNLKGGRNIIIDEARAPARMHLGTREPEKMGQLCVSACCS